MGLIAAGLGAGFGFSHLLAKDDHSELIEKMQDNKWMTMQNAQRIDRQDKQMIKYGEKINQVIDRIRNASWTNFMLEEAIVTTLQAEQLTGNAYWSEFSYFWYANKQLTTEIVSIFHSVNYELH